MGMVAHGTDRLQQETDEFNGGDMKQILPPLIRRRERVVEI
jgi:hypothetical protein